MLATPAKMFINALAMNTTPLITAVRDGNLTIVNELLKAGADPNMQDAAGITALYLAADGGNEDIIRVLLELKSKIKLDLYDQNGETALLRAVFQGNMPVVDQLLQAGANPSISILGGGMSPLMLAAQRGYDLTHLLIDYKVDPTYVDSNGNTAIHYALNDEVRKLLEEYTKNYKK